MSLYAALYRHRRDKWLWLTAAILHVAAFTVWQTTSADTHRDLERWFITVAMIMAIGFYGIIVAAFWVAQKTRLNKALALNKLFWGVLIAAIGLPAQTGWYDPAPQWVRAYIWVGLTLTISWVLYEFVHANWLRRDGWPWVERRINVRRDADRVLLARLESAEIELARYRGQFGELEAK